MEPVIVHLKHHLRLHDNPALFKACQTSDAVIPVFIVTDKMGSASKAWLYHSLQSFQASLKSIGLTLILRRGEEKKIIADLKKEAKTTTVFTNEPNLLFELGSIRTKEGRPYQVFTPFWKATHLLPIEKPLGTPSKGAHTPKMTSLSLEELHLQPLPSWDRDFWKTWEPGEKGAKKRLTHFLNGPISHYSVNRDFPFLEDGVSHLSPHLHFGEISIREIFHQVKKYPSFNRQLFWREFAHHLLYHFPHTIDQPLREEFSKFPWSYNKKRLKAWQEGKTGYPIVDAGMRELWQTGWMHNRVRMIVASFLIKDLLIHWKEGADWFMDTLVDADLANNTFGWQWVAGSGADAAPYFRIFNPTLQGKKFDPEGLYVKKYCPELASLPPKLVHTPWLSPNKLDYPAPIIDHILAKEKALTAFHAMARKK